jgi:putative transposase
LRRKEKPLATAAALLVLRKMGCVLLGGRGKLTKLAQRQKLVELIGEANTAGAGL